MTMTPAPPCSWWWRIGGNGDVAGLFVRWRVIHLVDAWGVAAGHGAALVPEMVHQLAGVELVLAVVAAAHGFFFGFLGFGWGARLSADPRRGARMAATSAA